VDRRRRSAHERGHVFYGILSLALLLVLLVAVIGWWLDRSYVETSLIDQTGSVATRRQVVKNSHQRATASEGIIASLSVLWLASGATGVW
jgi:membrane protein